MIHSPTVRRRRLSMLLRRFRESAGLEVVAAAKRLNWDPSKVSRIERDDWKRPSARDVRDLLELYGVEDQDVIDATIQLAQESRERGWWADYQDVLGAGSVAEFEAEAAKIHMFEALLIPGLLQTADYAAAVFLGGPVPDQAVIDRHVAARLARQAILDRDDPPHLWAVIDEAAIRKQVGGREVMQGQLRHVIQMCSRPTIAVQVVPDIAGAHAAMTGPFVIYEYTSPEDANLVYLETGTGDLFLEKPQEVNRYTVKYDHVRALALSEEASVAHLQALLDQP